MNNNKKIISLLLSMLMLSSSGSPVYANTIIGNIETDTEIIGDLQPISSSYPFDFEVISSDSDTAVVAFLADERNESSFYLGVKGEKEEAELVTPGQYTVEIGAEYSFVYNYTVNNERITYNGTLIAEDYDENGIIAKYSDVAVNRTYAGELTQSVKNSILSSYSTLSAGDKDEVESNDTYSLADRTYDDYDNYGTIDTESDVDWWKVEFDEDGEANFWLGNIPEDCDYDINLYDEYGVDDDRLAKSWNLNNEQELITVEVEANVTYYVEIYSANGCSDDYYTFRAKNYPYEEDDGDPFEGNDTFSYAYEINDGRTIRATIHNPDDVDYYEFYMDGSGEALIELYDIPGDCDYDLELYNNSRTRIARSTNGGNDDEYISTTLDEGWYYILVEPYDNTYSSNSYYALRLMITLDEVEPPDIPSDAFGFHVVDEYGDPIEDAAIYVYAQKNDDMLVNNDSDMPIPEPVYTDENGYAVITEVGTVNPSTYAVTYHDISSVYEYGINVTSPDSNSPTYAQYSFPDVIEPSTDIYEVVLVEVLEYPDYESPFGNNAVTPASIIQCQNWGWRYGLNSDIEFHTGMDINTVNGVSNRGDDVYSVSDGKVVQSTFANMCGEMVQVEGNDGYYTTYMHLKTGSRIALDTQVYAGENKIGNVGNTYKTNETVGYHLHISVSTNSSVNYVYPNTQYYIDPVAFIKDWDASED